MHARLRSPRARTSFALAGIGTMSLAAILTGCSAGTTDATDTSSDTSSTASPDATTDSSTGTATSGSYTDGDYSATGEYQSPGGQESIEVDVTLADGVVTAVTVTGNASGGNAERYQTEFEDGISAEVVGQSIDDLSVDKVAGSSLTSDGFNAAIEQIKTDAAA